MMRKYVIGVDSPRHAVLRLLSGGRQKARMAFGCLLGVAVLGLQGCPASELSDTPPFRYQLSTAPSTLDPALAGGLISAGVVDRLFDGLFRLDRLTGEPVLDLAQSYLLSDDSRVYTFQLVPHARFHNGREIRASDFKHSWERMLNPELDSSTSWIFELIEGAEDFQAGHADSVSGIRAEAPDVLVVILKKPFSSFLYHLALPPASVVPWEEVRRLGEAFGRQPVGSGPFRFHSWDSDRISLRPFASHHRAVPAVPELIYEVLDPDEALRRYQAGELDLLTSFPANSEELLRQAFSAQFRQFPGTLWIGFCFRTDKLPFSDPKVRRAVALAIDRDALVRELGSLRHVASVGFVPQGVPGHDPESLSRGLDLERARALLEESTAFQEGDFSAELFTRKGSRAAEQVAKSAQEGVSRLGFEAILKPMAAHELWNAQDRGRLPWFFYGWGAEYPDPEPYLRPLFHSRGSSNVTGYSNTEADRLLDEAQAESDPIRRLRLYGQAEDLVIEDAPCVALFQRSEAVLLRSEWQGIPVGYNPNFFEIELARWLGEPP